MIIKLQHATLGDISLELKATKRPLKGHDFEIRDSSGGLLAAGWVGGTQTECVQELIRLYTYDGVVGAPS